MCVFCRENMQTAVDSRQSTSFVFVLVEITIFTYLNNILCLTLVFLTVAALGLVLRLSLTGQLGRPHLLSKYGVRHFTSYLIKIVGSREESAPLSFAPIIFSSLIRPIL